jgi:hypothetical protein
MKYFNEKDFLYYPKMIKIMESFLYNFAIIHYEDGFRKIWKLYKDVKFS